MRTNADDPVTSDGVVCYFLGADGSARDSAVGSDRPNRAGLHAFLALRHLELDPLTFGPVSYTHLTLPTIYSV